MPVYLKKGEVFLSRKNFHLYAHTMQRKDTGKPGISPNEHAPKPYTPGNRPQPSPSKIITRIIEGASQRDTLDMVAYTMLFNSMRVGEVLNISRQSIDQMGRFKIESEKGSIGRIGNPGLLHSFFIQQRGKPGRLWEEWNRRTLHYHFDKRGYYLFPNKSSKRAVTHSMRHLSALTAQLSGFDNEQIQHELGHKSAKSTEWYTGSDNEAKTP